MVDKKILILVSGNVSRLNDFKNFKVTLGSFDDINFNLEDNIIRFKDKDLKYFDIIYFRYVAKGHEVATLISNYARENRIRIVDKVYEYSHLLSPSMAKSIELLKLSKSGIPVPKTCFTDFSKMPFPYIVKSTTDHNSDEVWLVKSKLELSKLRRKFNVDKNYFSQELIPNAVRIRVLIVGGRAIGSIIRSTKWNKEVVLSNRKVILNHATTLAIKASKAVGLEIAGVDVLTNDSGKYWVIETNADPAWKSVSKECNINVEEEIVKYLSL